MKRTLVLDTNVILTEPLILSRVRDDVVIPLAVVVELDAQKSRNDEIGRNARMASRMLDALRKNGNLFHGVKLEHDNTIRLMNTPDINLPVELSIDESDNQIIGVALYLQQNGENVVLMSRDINVRLKCDSIGVQSDDYIESNSGQRDGIDDDSYTGVDYAYVDDEQIQEFYSQNELFVETDCKFYPNQIIVLKSKHSSAIGRCVASDGGCYQIVLIKSHKNVHGLNPRNKEQNFSLDLLLNNDIKLVTLSGTAGVGKTLLALAAGLSQLKFSANSSGQYEKLIITRSIQTLGKDIGFLPGTIEEKMEPWVAPMRDNINFLVKNHKRRNQKETFMSMLQDRGLLEIEALSYIRGRSIPNAYMIVDECQNLNIHEIKTIITRIGENTKLILLGDVSQIDNPHLDAENNALSYVIEKFKDQDIAGHVTLIRGERSELATIASQIL